MGKAGEHSRHIVLWVSCATNSSATYQCTLPTQPVTHLAAVQLGCKLCSLALSSGSRLSLKLSDSSL